uniref:Uncharacterized protein n=1 Tax=Panagrolaimus sp. ES5 TaxID=591445 RepID=A0AC34F379_9BILA
MAQLQQIDAQYVSNDVTTISQNKENYTPENEAHVIEYLSRRYENLYYFEGQNDHHEGMKQLVKLVEGFQPTTARGGLLALLRLFLPN